MYPTNWKKFMNKASQRKQKKSLVRLIRNRLLVVASLLVFAFLFNFLVGNYVSNRQYNLGEQKVALQQDRDALLIAMPNQETGLRGYIATNNPVFLEPFNSGRPQYLLSVQQLKNQAHGIQATDFSATNTVLAQVVVLANAWYSTYAEVQIKNMHTGNLAAARSPTTDAVGKGLFDTFRASLEHLQQAIDHDVNSSQMRVAAFNRFALLLAFLMSAIALSILGYTFIMFVKGLLEDLNILKAATNQQGSGNLSARVQELTYQELNSLGQTFNTMAEELAIRSHELEGSVEELATRSHELERSNAAMYQLAAIVEYSGDAILGKTLQGVITSWNSSAEKLFGYAADEIIGKSVSLVTPPDRQEELPQILARITAGESVHHYETTRMRKDGTHIEVSVTVSPIRDPNGRIIAASTIVHDITEQKRMIEELITLNSALEEANRARSQFLSTMSHELRTPLASIIGFSQMLLDDADIANLNQQQHNDLERILKNGQHLLSLINDVLDLTKIDAGRMVVNYSQVDVRELLTSVVEETQSIAITRHLVLRAEVDEGMDFLESNPLKLRQVLLNLVSNALKFTEQGEVTVSAKRVISPDQEGECVAIAVKDSGIGIPADIQEHVFEAFYQADGTYTRKAGGTGLGLSIVSQLITLLGGTIAVKSAPGQGSTFTVMLPIKAVHQYIEQNPPRLHLAQPREAPRIPPSSGDLPPAMSDGLLALSAHRGVTDGQNNLILAVDDNPDVIVLIKAALKDTPYTVVGLQDSLKAMELAQELHPCAIMLDVMMPNLNGWQILHRLKENPATAYIPVMMITVLTEPTTGYVLGADAYLIKPFKTNVLLNTLRHLLTSQNGRSQADEREAQRV
jgi:two-component system, chemotaxis family, sensor kinase CheA